MRVPYPLTIIAGVVAFGIAFLGAAYGQMQSIQTTPPPPWPSFFISHLPVMVPFVLVVTIVAWLLESRLRPVTDCCIVSQCSGRVRVATNGSFGTIFPGASRDPPEIVIRYAAGGTVMRRMMIIFGVLDLGIVATYASRVPAYVRNLGVQPWLSVVCLAVMASLVASGYGLLRGRRWAFFLNYVQFPFRVALAFLSFTWLAELVAPNNSPIQLHEAVWVSAVALEGVRLGLTPMLHLRGRGQQHNRPLLWTGPHAA